MIVGRFRPGTRHAHEAVRLVLPHQRVHDHRRVPFLAEDAADAAQRTPSSGGALVFHRFLIGHDAPRCSERRSRKAMLNRRAVSPSCTAPPMVGSNRSSTLFNIGNSVDTRGVPEASEVRMSANDTTSPRQDDGSQESGRIGMLPSAHGPSTRERVVWVALMTVEQIAAFVLCARDEDWGGEARRRLKRAMLDTVGCVLGALGAAPARVCAPARSCTL